MLATTMGTHHASRFPVDTGPFILFFKHGLPKLSKPYFLFSNHILGGIKSNIFSQPKGFLSGAYSHWNNRYIPHWNATKDMMWPHVQHVPPYDISSSYYPVLGTYSSRSTEVMEDHMQQILQAEVGRFQAGRVGVREEGRGEEGAITTCTSVSKLTRVYLLNLFSVFPWDVF